jgi:Spy/CpxP family protein refolding chaperone
MPEEIEVPTEHLHETLHEHAGGHSEHAGAPPWTSAVALSAAILAVLAAVASLLAGHHANEAMLEQMQASDAWAFYQAKSIKASVLDTRLQLLAAMNKPGTDSDRQKLATYEDDGKKIEEQGKENEAASRKHMERHNGLARAVTVLQVAIALAAIAVLTRKRNVWFGALGLGAIGAVFIALSVI